MEGRKVCHILFSPGASFWKQFIPRSVLHSAKPFHESQSIVTVRYYKKAIFLRLLQYGVSPSFFSLSLLKQKTGEKKEAVCTRVRNSEKTALSFRRI